MEHSIDVSMLEPCEPLERTLAAVQQLVVGDYLRVIHRREPHPLYQLLEKGNFSWHTIEHDADNYEIYIWHQDDRVAEQVIQQQIERVK